MPNDNQANQPLTEKEKQRVHDPTDRWTDQFALKTVVQDFNKASNHRAQNHDHRWRNADELYLAWVGRKFWPGTRIDRSNLGVFTTLTQIESLLPRMMSTLFADAPGWFFADALPGTDPADARLVRELMIEQMRQSRIREVFRRAFKSAFLYGNGLIELGMLYQETQRPFFRVDFIPQTRRVRLPFLGGITVTLPTGINQRRITEETRQEIINRPFAKSVSLKDIYVDPNCSSPQPQDGRFLIKRAFMTVDELDRLRDQPGFKIPPKLQLILMAEKKPTTEGDRTKESMENIRGNTWTSSQDTSVDPGSKRLEVLGYWTKERHVWVLNREHTAYNIPNPVEIIPFFDVFYTDVPDRFYGLAVTDLAEPDQRLIQGIINARIDELALSIHKGTIKRRGTPTPAYQRRIYPGRWLEVDGNPRDEIVREEVQNITQQAFAEVDLAERRVARSTGVTDLAVLGTGPGKFGNAASRTATGVNTQAQASASRHGYLVENNEDTVVEPLLDLWHKFNTLFLDPDQVQEIVDTKKDILQIEPVRIKNARVKFAMRASSKLQARAGLLQVLPLIFETILSPALLELLARQQGKTVNVEELENMVLDATNYRPKQGLFRDLTDEEKQQLNQQPPEEQTRMQMQQERLQAQGTMQREKLDADLEQLVTEKILEVIAQQQTSEGTEGEA